MPDINLTSAVRSNLLALQNTADLLAQTQERLSTGLKVNSALDDPTAFFTAESLNNRASDLDRLLDSIGTAVSTIEATDKAISAITDLVEAAQGTARQALQNAGETAKSESTIDHSETADLTALAGVNAGDEISIQVGAAAAVNVAINAGDTIDDLAANIAAADPNVSASVSDGKLVIEAINGEDLTIGEATGTPLADLGLTAETVTGSINETRANLSNQFEDLRNQIDQLAQDSSFNGINLLQGDNLEVLFNEDGTHSISIDGVDFDAEGLGINGAVNSFQDDGSIDLALDELDAAIETLRSQARTFGSNLSVVETRENFTKSFINTLEGAAGKLTLADTNEEGANLLALQTRQQLSSTSLSFASQADQNVLQLF